MKPIYLTAFPDSTTEAAWHECLGDSDFASHYTAPEFFLEPYFKDRQFAVLAMEGPRVEGILTGVFNGNVADSGLGVRPQLCLRRSANVAETCDTLVRGLLEHAQSNVQLLSLYSWIKLPSLRERGFRERECSADAGTILLDLTKGHDALFKQFSETRRNKIRRALKAGVEVVELTSDEDFETYYEIYKDWCHFKELPVLSHEMQKAAFELKNNRLVLLAKHEGRVIGASTFRYCKGGIVEYAANVSRREETKVRQNDLLLWKGIEWSSQQGFKIFSMAGAHFFLQKFGGSIHTTYGYRLDRSLFRRHNMYDFLMESRNNMYRRLPEKMRETLKARLSKQPGSGEN